MTNFSDRYFIGDGRNYLHNSGFEINSRTLPITSTGYTSDRWVTGSNGAVAWSANVSTTSPVDDIRLSHAIEITTADTSIAATDYLVFLQRMEGYDFLPFVGRTGTVSFWVRSSVTGVYSLSARSGSLDMSYVAQYTINEADTWEYKKIVIPFNYSGGTWDYTTEKGLELTWALMCGSTYQTTPNTWAASNYIATAEQANFAATIGNTFYIAGPKLELGSIATPYILPDLGQEFQKCMRYREYIYLSADALSAGTGAGNYYFWIYYQVRKRIIPTITVASARVYLSTAGWRSATDATSDYTPNVVGSRMHFVDSANSDYTAGRCGLIDGTFTINAEL